MFPPLRRALNTVGRKAYTRIVRNLASETGAQQKRVRALIKPIPSNRTLEWKAQAKARYFSLKDFNPRQTSTGVKVSVWGGQTIPHAFIVDSLGGHVYFRAGPPRVMVKGKYRGQKRQPLEKLWGPNLAVQMSRGGTRKVLDELAGRELVPEVLRQAGLEIERKGRAAIESAKSFGGKVERVI